MVQSLRHGDLKRYGVCENCLFDHPLQNSELLSKYTFMTFNILAFFYVFLSPEKKDQN